mgnify:FL=1
MVKHFYSFIVETDSLFLEIDSLSISTSEKAHLKSLAESHIHHSILDSIMSELSSDDKKLFLSHLNTKNHEKIWNFLYARIADVEEKIKEAAHKIKKELHKDIREVNN